MRNINRDIVEVFTNCDFCHELVPAGDYCSKCGKRQISDFQFQMKIIEFDNQILCTNCGQVVLKDTHCSNCGFLFVKASTGQGMSYVQKKRIVDSMRATKGSVLISEPKDDFSEIHEENL